MNDHGAEEHFRQGNTLLAQGRPADALASYDRALSLDPAHAAALALRGEALIGIGRIEEALASYDRAIALRPDSAIVQCNHGTLLLETGRFDAALASFDRAIALDPGNADALSNRGNALAALRRHDDALASFDRALEVRPGDPMTLFNRGNTLIALQRPADAVAAYDRALAVRPGEAAILYNRANALVELHRFDLALADYDRVLAHVPAHADALNNRGNVLLRLKRVADALAAYELALATQPGHVDALGNRGYALWEAGRYAEAGDAFAETLRRAPEWDYARGNLLRCRLRCCDWTDLERQVADVTCAVDRGARSAVPLGFIAVSDSAPAQLRCARTYADDLYPPSSRPLWTGTIYRHERIRVAYLSADFHEHATTHLAARLFELADRARFEVHAMSFGPDSTDAMRARLVRAFDRFDDVRALSDREVGEHLREREIEIAVDLKGFTADCRTGILAQRAAPIQVEFLGYPGSTGADYIDYIVADDYVIPAGQDAFYTEKVVRLPDSYQVNDATRTLPVDAPTRAQVGLPERGFVFCCFNNTWKITPAFFDIWMRVLTRVPGSVLWLLDDNPHASANLRREAAVRGVVPERLVFAPRVGQSEHLARHRLADLFLDTLPCNAHTTASDALWTGLPVLTCSGRAFASRVAGSLLRASGIPELVTQDVGGYEALALRLATDPARLATLRARLERDRKTCALFDTDRFRRHLEAAFSAMWARYQRGEPPAAFAVARSAAVAR